jgi:hypothetical protein
MNRWMTNFLGIAVIALVFWLVGRNWHPAQPIGHLPMAPAASGTTGDDDGGGLMYAYGGDAGVPSDDGGPLLWTDLLGAETRLDGGAGMTMPDGLPVPPLPFTVPRQVRFGVVLVSYAGAQPSPGGGRPVARSSADARALADSLLATAQQDFHAAVQRGDSGSAEDIGRVKVGILEPAPEYVLFTLPVGGVGRPVDTPRGYWIVKRLE